MPLGKLFRHFSLQALSRRWFKRFGRSLKNRFLRQDVHRKWMRAEPLEERSLLSTIYWLGAASSNWNSDSWSAANDGTADATLRPQNNDTLVFNTTTSGFSATNGF